MEAELASFIGFMSDTLVELDTLTNSVERKLKAERFVAFDCDPNKVYDKATGRIFAYTGQRYHVKG